MTYMRFVIYPIAGAVGLKSGPGVKKLQEKCMTDPKMCVLEPSFVIYSCDDVTLSIKSSKTTRLQTFLSDSLHNSSSEGKPS